MKHQKMTNLLKKNVNLLIYTGNIQEHHITDCDWNKHRFMKSCRFCGFDFPRRQKCSTWVCDRWKMWMHTISRSLTVFVFLIFLVFVFQNVNFQTVFDPFATKMNCWKVYWENLSPLLQWNVFPLPLCFYLLFY
jgi:hypothetical protein